MSQNPNKRYIGKVRNQNGKNGNFKKILVDNPDPNSEYNKGSLLWLDKATGKTFLVKQFSVGGVSEQSLQKGFVESISIDLSSSYEVEDLSNK